MNHPRECYLWQTKKKSPNSISVFPVINSLLPVLAWHAKSPFCGTGVLTGAPLLADVPACQLHWKNNWRVRLGWVFPAFLSPHNEVKMWDNRSWCWPVRAGGPLLGEGVTGLFLLEQRLVLSKYIYIYIIWLGSGLLYFNESHTHGSTSVGPHSSAGNC